MKFLNANIDEKSDLVNLLYSMRQKNLVYNYDFLYFSNKNEQATPVIYNHPDGWIYTNDNQSASIGFDQQNGCCVIKTGPGTNQMIFSQALHEFPDWERKLKGQTITAIAHMNLSGSSDTKVNLTLSDGIKEKTSSIKTIGNVEVRVEIEVDNNATGLVLRIESTTPSAVININKVYANIGLIAIESLQCIVTGVIGERKQYVATENAPAEELSLCNESKELSINNTRLHSVLNKRFGSGSNGMSLLPDMRGYFSRSWDNGASIDPDASTREKLGLGNITGDHVGTVEEDIFYEHLHSLSFSPTNILPGKDGAAKGVVSMDTKTAKTGAEDKSGKETRPKNIFELFTIKWA